MPDAPTPPYISRQTVHFDMLDALHMLHNAQYLVLFERARLEFWKAHLLDADGKHHDWPYHVARNEVNYRAAVYAPQPVTVSVAVERVGNSSLAFVQELRAEDGSLAADARAVLVRVGHDTRRPIPWSDAFRARVAPFVLPAE